jgi:hypothetical protein
MLKQFLYLFLGAILWVSASYAISDARKEEIAKEIKDLEEQIPPIEAKNLETLLEYYRTFDWDHFLKNYRQDFWLKIKLAELKKELANYVDPE